MILKLSLFLSSMSPVVQNISSSFFRFLLLLPFWHWKTEHLGIFALKLIKTKDGAKRSISRSDRVRLRRPEADPLCYNATCWHTCHVYFTWRCMMSDLRAGAGAADWRTRRARAPPCCAARSPRSPAASPCVCRPSDHKHSLSNS